MIAYLGNPGSGQQVYVENQGTQTIVTLISSSSGQQQSQSTSFETGSWVKPPVLFRDVAGFILQIEATEGSRFVLLQAHGISSCSETPSLGNAEVLPLQETTEMRGLSMQPMQPMQPIKPMQPMKPMEMRMGNMEMRMGTATPATRRFCTQCGNQVSEGDRFCTFCGHSLTPA